MEWIFGTGRDERVLVAEDAPAVLHEALAAFFRGDTVPMLADSEGNVTFLYEAPAADAGATVVVAVRLHEAGSAYLLE